MDHEIECDLLKDACAANRSGAWRYCFRTDTIQWTSVMYDLFGAPHGKEINLEFALSHFDDEARRELVELLDRCQTHGEDFDTIVRACHSSGSWFWSRVTGKAELKEDGTIAALRGSFQDITAQVEAQVKLEKLEADYRFMVENITSGIAVHAPDSTLLYANSASRIMLGTGDEEIEGRLNSDPRWQVVDEDENPLTADEFPVAHAINLRRQITQVLGNRRADDNSRVWLDCTATPIFGEDGEVSQVLVSFTDITQLKEAERRTKVERDRSRKALAQLRETESRFQIIADAVSDVIWERNLETGTYIITEDWVKKLGLEMKSDDKAGIFDASGIDEAETVRAAYERFLASDDDQWTCEYEMTDDLGQTITVALEARVFRKEDMTPTRIVGSLRNVTAQKRQREGFTQARALEVVGRLTGGVAHDFNNLLMVIQSNAELMQMGELDEEDRESVDLILEATQSAGKLTERLLSFSGKRRLGPERLDPSDLVHRARDLVQSGFTEAYSVTVDISDDLWPIIVDPNELQQAILNLCLNSRDAMENGGSIIISGENRTFDDHSAQIFPDCEPGDYVGITVTDTGCGIPREAQPRIFEPYFTTKDVGKGTGLGLSTVFGFVRQSGGHIAVYSEEGHGTSITMYFPRTSAEGEAEPEMARPAGRIFNEKASSRILIVEDQPFVRRQVERTLKRLGYETETAEDARAALAKIELSKERGETFNLVFTDVIMPGGMNGKQLADEIARLSPGMRIVFTSGYPASAFDKLGVDEMKRTRLLRKPYTLEELKRTLSEALKTS